jgi:hypothetical protein
MPPWTARQLRPPAVRPVAKIRIIDTENSFLITRGN